MLGTTIASASGAWSYTPTGLANGAHTLVASETDAAGNTGSASLAFTLDTTAPNAPVIISDATTSATTLIVGGTAEAGSAVKLF